MGGQGDGAQLVREPVRRMLRETVETENQLVPRHPQGVHGHELADGPRFRVQAHAGERKRCCSAQNLSGTELLSEGKCSWYISKRQGRRQTDKRTDEQTGHGSLCERGPKCFCAPRRGQTAFRIYMCSRVGHAKGGAQSICDY